MIKAEIQVRELEVSYETSVALRCDQLRIEGNTIGVVGKNGAGKSTLLKTILGLLRPRRGYLTASILTPDGGVQVLSPQRHMAFCPEMGSIFLDMTVESYLAFWSRLRHRDAKYYRTKGSFYLSSLEIEPLLRRKGRELSKGERRRIQTVIGFILEPKLFLFDEPFDGLDVQKTHQLVELIRSRHSEIAFIVSSHRMDVIERISDMIVVLRRGGILSVGPLDKVVGDLGGRSFLLWLEGNSLVENSLVEDGGLGDAFPGVVVSRLGNQIRITGKGLEKEALESYFTINGMSRVILEELPPSLADAMTYHLNQPDPTTY